MGRISPIPGVLLIAVFAQQSAAEPVNPFARPFQEAPAGPQATELAASGRPELRGVIVAGQGSIANLSGTLLALGEEAAGYHLESVTEYSATFVHKGEPIILYLKDEQPEAPE